MDKKEVIKQLTAQKKKKRKVSKEHKEDFLH